VGYAALDAWTAVEILSRMENLLGNSAPMDTDSVNKESALFFAVAVGKQVGIYDSKSAAKGQTDGYPGGKWRAFKNLENAQKYVVSGVATAAGLKNLFPVATETGNNKRRRSQSNQTGQGQSTMLSGENRSHRKPRRRIKRAQKP